MSTLSGAHFCAFNLLPEVELCFVRDGERSYFDSKLHGGPALGIEGRPWRQALFVRGSGLDEVNPVGGHLIGEVSVDLSVRAAQHVEVAEPVGDFGRVEGAEFGMIGPGKSVVEVVGVGGGLRGLCAVGGPEIHCHAIVVAAAFLL